MSTETDNTRWTGDKAATFLKLLARSGKVAECARAVGMSRQSAYRLRARAPNFSDCWDMAMGEAERRRASSRRSRKRVHPLLSPHRIGMGSEGPVPGDGSGPGA